jgi:hypothetical protein
MPSKNEEVGKFSENLKKDGKQISETVKRYPLISLCFIFAVLFLIMVPYLQVDYQEINNSTEKAIIENQYRVTLAQMFGGAAIGISLYYTWKRIGIAEENLKTSQEGQINERFMRAIDQ